MSHKHNMNTSNQSNKTQATAEHDIDRKNNLNHHSEQQNPNNDKHQKAVDNRANQLNKNNERFQVNK